MGKMERKKKSIAIILNQVSDPDNTNNLIITFPIAMTKRTFTNIINIFNTMRNNGWLKLFIKT